MLCLAPLPGWISLAIEKFSPAELPLQPKKMQVSNEIVTRFVGCVTNYRLNAIWTFGIFYDQTVPGPLVFFLDKTETTDRVRLIQFKYLMKLPGANA